MHCFCKGTVTCHHHVHSQTSKWGLSEIVSFHFQQIDLYDRAIEDLCIWHANACIYHAFLNKLEHFLLKALLFSRFLIGHSTSQHECVIYVTKATFRFVCVTRTTSLCNASVPTQKNVAILRHILLKTLELRRLAINEEDIQADYSCCSVSQQFTVTFSKHDRVRKTGHNSIFLLHAIYKNSKYIWNHFF